MTTTEDGARQSVRQTLWPVEIQFIFSIKDAHGDPHTFTVAVDLLDDELDLAVSLARPDDAGDMLPEDLFETVRVALSLVRSKVRKEDLVERDD